MLEVCFLSPGTLAHNAVQKQQPDIVRGIRRATFSFVGVGSKRNALAMCVCVNGVCVCVCVFVVESAPAKPVFVFAHWLSGALEHWLRSALTQKRIDSEAHWLRSALAQKRIGSEAHSLRSAFAQKRTGALANWHTTCGRCWVAVVGHGSSQRKKRKLLIVYAYRLVTGWGSIVYGLLFTHLQRHRDR